MTKDFGKNLPNSILKIRQYDNFWRTLQSSFSGCINYFTVEYEIFAALTKATVVIKQKQSEKIAQQLIRKEF